MRHELPRMGHRNFIVIADSAYPLQSSPGIRTLHVGGTQAETLKKVLALLAQGAAALAADAKPQPQAAAPAALKPASAQDRMEAQRLPALGRAAFWAREVDRLAKA